MDTLSPSERSARLAAIRTRSTGPEIAVRSLVHRMGYRYALHAKDLPGSPDLVFRAKAKAIFVHGCFWHFHRNCRKGHPPKSNLNYWKVKLERNRERDRSVCRRLRRIGWSVLVVWECQIGNPKTLAARINRFLNEL